MIEPESLVDLNFEYTWPAYLSVCKVEIVVLDILKH